MKKTEKMIHQNIRFRSRIDTFLVSIEEFPRPSNYTCCKYSNRMEDAIDAFKMIFDGKQSWLLGWTVVFMVSVAFFNYAGLFLNTESIE